MRRKVMLFAGWASATVAATLIALLALGRVTDQVAPPQALPLPAAAVELLTESPEPTDAPVAVVESDPPGATEAEGDGPSVATDAPADSPDQPAQDEPPAEQPADEPSEEPANQPNQDDRPGQPAQEPAEEEPGEPDEPEDAGEPAAAERTEGYELTGGVVTVRYRSGTTRLVQATPNSGFIMEVHDRGPGKVDVRFRSDDHESRLVAEWRDGSPDVDREERER